MHMSKNNIFKENFQRYIDGFYSKNELESILKQIKNYCTDEDIDHLTEQLWSNLGDETLANRFEKATCEKEADVYKRQGYLLQWAYLPKCLNFLFCE